MQRTLLLTLLLVPASASAGTAAENVASHIEPILTMLPALRESPASRMFGSDLDASECYRAIKAGSDAGLADDARIYAYRFRELADDVHFDDDHEPYLELGELTPLCREYGQLQEMVKPAYAQQEALEKITVYSSVSPKDLGSDMGQQLAAMGEQCLAATDEGIRNGAPADRKSKIGTLELTLEEGKTQICQALIDFGRQAAGDIKAAHDAELDRIAAKYKKAGIKGAKLKLFVENDNVAWMTKGCQTLSDVKKLAKAKKLFQWWDGADGSITIRTYTFKGNNVKSIKNKIYWLPENAYRGCK